LIDLYLTPTLAVFQLYRGFFDLLLYDEISKEYSGNSFKLQKFTLSKNI
jgi:hypothetical protein